VLLVTDSAEPWSFAAWMRPNATETRATPIQARRKTKRIPFSMSMAQARRLLVETDLAVEEVGHRVGYRDPGYFVRTFRRSHGTTPLG
jgi:transcriptional regulator GlxA family with amidase domain